MFVYSVFKSVLLCFAYCRSVMLQINPLATLYTYLPAVCLIIYTRIAWHARVLIIYGNKGSVVFVHRTLIGTCHNLVMGGSKNGCKLDVNFSVLPSIVLRLRPSIVGLFIKPRDTFWHLYYLAS